MLAFATMCGNARVESRATHSCLLAQHPALAAVQRRLPEGEAFTFLDDIDVGAAPERICARGYASGSYWAQTIFSLLAKNLERLRFETLLRETCYHAFSRHTTTAQSDMLYKCSVKRSHAP